MKSLRLTVFPPLSPTAYLGGRHELPFPLNDDRCSLYKLGRHCLWHGVRALGIKDGTILVPAYHHGSEIEVLKRSGLSLRFYDIDDSLEPVLDGLGDRLDDVRALYLIHYLGWPQNAGFWRKWCDERGIYLIEDVAQGWLGHRDGVPLGSWGDIAIFCLYKQLGVPDGGALIARGAERPRAGRAFGLKRLVQRHAAWLASRSSLATRLAPRVVERPKDEIASRDFALGDPATPPLRATTFLLPRTYAHEVAAKRRDNYAHLLRHLGDLVAPGFDRLPEGASPFAFPIAVDDKDRLYHYLTDRMILPQDLWAIPHPDLTGDWPGAARLRSSVIALPVHQDLRRTDLDLIVQTVRRGYQG